MANDRQLEHWQRTLDGAPALTEAPTDRARPPKVEPTHFANVKQYIPPVLLDTLNKKATYAKLKGFYLATWQVCAETPIASCCNSLPVYPHCAIALR